MEKLQLNTDFATKEIAVAPGWVMLSMRGGLGVKKPSDFVPFPSTLTIAARSPQRRIAALLSSAATDRSKTKSFPPPARPGERRGDGDTLGRLGLLWPKAEAFVGHQFPLLTSCRSAAVLWLHLWGIAQTPQIKAKPEQSCSPGPLVSLPPAP